MINASKNPIEVFFSYSHEDDLLRQKLEKHLSLLQQLGLINGWHDRKIAAGTDWKSAIDDHLTTARVILLLISCNFLASNYCSGIEMKRALERHASGEAHVIPILLSPVDLENAPFEYLQCLPSNATPITCWKNREAAFADVAKGIRNSIKELTFPPENVPSTTHSLTGAISHPHNFSARMMLLKSVPIVLMIASLITVPLGLMMIIHFNETNRSYNASIGSNHITSHNRSQDARNIRETVNSTTRETVSPTISSGSPGAKIIYETTNDATHGATDRSSTHEAVNAASSREASSGAASKHTIKITYRPTDEPVSPASPSGISSTPIPENFASTTPDTSTSYVFSDYNHLVQNSTDNNNDTPGAHNYEHQIGRNNIMYIRGDYNTAIQDGRH